MAVSFDRVFGDWHSVKSLGIGTDGRVYLIEKKDENGKTEQGILKTIRVGDYRNESNGYNTLTALENNIESSNDEKYIQSVTDSIVSNVEAIKKNDGGKRFVAYEEYEVRPTSDGKGKIILLRLEQMRSLTQLLTQFSFTFTETINLGISVCKALMRCRDFGYIYPNLKPENILFDKRGVCKLGDLGSFSCLEPSKTSVAFKRTQYYMAPEFIKTGKINCTCDTYSLGLVLYMLSNRGRLPFCEKYPQDVTAGGLDFSKEQRMNGAEFEKPQLASQALFEIIKKACAFSEKDRYLSPKQMMTDLQNALENKPLARVEFDDIYSVSKDNPRTEEKENDENVIGEKPADEEPQEIQKKPASLMDEISIPDVTPGDYSNGKTNPRARRRRPAPTVTITPPEKKKKVDSSEVLKIAIISILILCVIVLFGVSMKLRSNQNEENETTTHAVVSASLTPEVVINGGRHGK